MQEFAPLPRLPHAFIEEDRDLRMKQALKVLEAENGQLKQLVIRLSETIIKNVLSSR